jgi:hydroxymethylpyrimidine/phosphomethylpyrimidine kinase
MVKKVLTIAGSDCSGGAGIQADIKTITVHKMYAMSAITALTVQNTTGVFGIVEVAPEFIGRQIDSIFSDIVPDAVKIGMVSNSGAIKVIAERLQYYKAKNIVVDPVMVSTSGSKLLLDDARETLVTRLLPLAEIVTPNIPEAVVLSGFNIAVEKDMAMAAKHIAKGLKGAVLVKGGHLIADAADVLVYNNTETWLRFQRVETTNTHGTGCTLSSAIACSMAAGYPPEESVRRAKSYLTGALRAGLNLGKGSGPLDHTYSLKAEPAY